MSAFVACIAMSLAASTFGAEPVPDRILSHFTSDNYTVTWATAATWEPNADLEIGEGWGHGGALCWMRFHPRQGEVEILSVELGKGWQAYESKRPLDNGSVAVKHAQMKCDAYAALLRDLAVVGSAELKPIPIKAGKGERIRLSTLDFWVFARLTASGKTLFDLDWAGYEGDLHEAEYARPQAAVGLVREAVEGLDFTDHALTEEERAWASLKFARDWNKTQNWLSYWWVRERYLVMIGVVGDRAALSTLRGILEGSTYERCLRYAINAVTRLTKKDVRDITAGRMNMENTRRKVLDLLGEEVEKDARPGSNGPPN